LWWYLPLLPVILFPWVLWLPVWRGLLRLRGEGGMGVRLCLAWLLPVFLAFSFISGKQMHYLLPIFPAFALLAARGLLHEESRRFDQLPAALAAIAIGVLLIGLPHYAQSHQMAHWIQSIPVWTGAAVILAGLALAAMPSATLQANVWRMTLFSAATVVLTIYIALIRTAGPAYDVREMGKRLKAYQDAGVPLAHADEYPGQYQFVGRMVSEPEIVRKSRLTDWFKAHPEGKAVVYFDADEPLDGVPLDYRQPYLNQQVVILGRDAWPVPKPHAP
jgi:4-amino-4-deoxy-L-arabinose transferase-like glycosyltransferase